MSLRRADLTALGVLALTGSLLGALAGWWSLTTDERDTLTGTAD